MRLSLKSILFLLSHKEKWHTTVDVFGAFNLFDWHEKEEREKSRRSQGWFRKKKKLPLAIYACIIIRVVVVGGFVKGWGGGVYPTPFSQSIWRELATKIRFEVSLTAVFNPSRHTFYPWPEQQFLFDAKIIHFGLLNSPQSDIIWNSA
jgi:hypothetical protein